MLTDLGLTFPSSPWLLELPKAEIGVLVSCKEPFAPRAVESGTRRSTGAAFWSSCSNTGGISNAFYIGERSRKCSGRVSDSGAR